MLVISENGINNEVLLRKDVDTDMCKKRIIQNNRIRGNSYVQLPSRDSNVSGGNG